MCKKMTKKDVAKYMQISVRRLDNFLNIVSKHYNNTETTTADTLTEKQLFLLDSFFDLDIFGICRAQKPDYKPIYFYNIYRKKDFAKLLNITDKELQRDLKFLQGLKKTFFENYDPQRKILSVDEMFYIDWHFVRLQLTAEPQKKVLFDFPTKFDYLKYENDYPA